jgi:hypothetical protein
MTTAFRFRIWSVVTMSGCLLGWWTPPKVLNDEIEITETRLIV